MTREIERALAFARRRGLAGQLFPEAADDP
jgi:hypothetical protein